MGIACLRSCASTLVAGIVLAAPSMASGDEALFPFRLLPIGAGALGSSDQPSSALFLDLGGDGWPDLVTAHLASGMLGVTRGTGDGTFGAHQLHALGTSLLDAKSADVTGDGVPDLVVIDADLAGNLDIATVPIDGFGHLLTPVTNPTGADELEGALPGSLLALGDLTGNGIPDAVLIMDSGAPVRVTSMRGHASGLFTLPQHHVVGNRPRSVALADLSGDGELDLLASLSSPSTSSQPEALTVSLGKTGAGNGSFGAAATYVVSGAPQAIQVADLDLDGQLDVLLPLAALGAAGNAVQAWLGTGTGGLIAQPVTPLPGPPGSSLLVDLDHDGLDDLLVQTGDTLTTLRSLGNGQFGAQPPAATGPSWRLALADLDLDGRNDLVQVDDALLVRRGLRGFAFESDVVVGPRLLPAGTGITELRAADLDQDGRPELLALVANQSWVAVQWSQPGGGVGLPQAAPVPLANAQDLDVADMDQDGMLDLVVCGGLLPSTPALAVLRSDGVGGFRASSAYPDGDTGWMVNVTVGDLDDDGVPDAVGEHFGDIDRFDGDGLGGLLPPAALAALVHVSEMELADLDLDGRLDLLVCSYTEGLLTLRGLGGGAFGPALGWPSTGDGCVDVVPSDTDGDGDLDLVLASSRTQVLHLTNAGDGSFPSTIVVDLHAKPVELAWADLDRDERFELVYSDADRGLTVMHDQGGFVFDAPLHFHAPDAGELALLDVDGDGDLDLVTAPVDAIALRILENQARP